MSGRVLKIMLALVLPASSCGPLPLMGESVVPLAKADGWRRELIREARAWAEEGGHDTPFGVVEVAFDHETAVRAWSENVSGGLAARDGRPVESGIYGDLDEVDFDTHAVVVWSSGQSGTCPGWLADITADDGEVEARTGEHVPGDACTDDYNAYRMVIAVDRGQLPGADGIPATVRIDGRLDGLAVPYPFHGGQALPDLPLPGEGDL